jgi:hypothetical protein
VTGPDIAVAFFVIVGVVVGAYGIWQTFFEDGTGSGFGGGDGSSGTSI